MILQLNPPLIVETPKGEGMAHFLIDHGMEHHLQWVVFIKKTGECWVFANPDIRQSYNFTMGRLPQEYPWRKFWGKAEEFLNKEKQDNGRTEGSDVQQPPDPPADTGGAT